MVRLGLSDSMRSSVSLEDTEPLHTATHRQLPRRLHVASVPAAEAARNPQLKTNTNAKAETSLVFSSRLRALLVGLVAVIAFSTGLRLLVTQLRQRSSSETTINEQFGRLESSFELLGKDTARLQTSAERLLQRCQEAQVAASTRSEMLQNSARRNFDEQAAALTHEHEQVTQQVLRYYKQQEQKIREMRERLVEMNVTLPVRFAVQPTPESWKQDEQRLQGQSEGMERGQSGLADAMEGLAVFEGEAPHHDATDYERLCVSIQMEDSTSRTTVQQSQSSSSRSSFFYTFVACASAVYLWSAVSESRKKELRGDKWFWSPVPKVFRRLKTLLGSVVVRFEGRRCLC